MIGERTKSRVLRLLEEAESRVSNVTYEDLPRKYLARANTIRNKLVDLREDIMAESAAPRDLSDGYGTPGGGPAPLD